MFDLYENWIFKFCSSQCVYATHILWHIFNIKQNRTKQQQKKSNNNMIAQVRSRFAVYPVYLSTPLHLCDFLYPKFNCISYIYKYAFETTTNWTHLTTNIHLLEISLCWRFTFVFLSIDDAFKSERRIQFHQSNEKVLQPI